MPGLINKEDALLLIIDVQEKLFNVVQNKENVLKNLIKLIKACKVLNIPILITEQYPKGLGKTVKEIVEELGEQYNPIEKLTFSCFRTSAFREAVSKLMKHVIIITGIEFHICVFQTAIDARENGFRPIVVVDATSTRKEIDYKTAINRLLVNDIELATTEMVIYELLKDASKLEFKKILKIIKM